MPRPVPMTRALIVGPRENLEATVERLYGLKLVHIVDHREGEEGLEIGRPLPTASEASEILVKLRSIASVLQLEETPPAPTDEVAGDPLEPAHRARTLGGTPPGRRRAVGDPARAVRRLSLRREGSPRGDGREGGSAAPIRRDRSHVHRRRLGPDGILRETRGRARTFPGAVRHGARAESSRRTRGTGARRGGSARPAPESEAPPTVRDAREALLHAELPRDRSDVCPDLHVPDLLRPHGCRRRLRARVDGLRNLAASTVEGPRVGLLEEPPRHAHMGRILVPPVRRLLLL